MNFDFVKKLNNLVSDQNYESLNDDPEISMETLNDLQNDKNRKIKNHFEENIRNHLLISSNKVRKSKLQKLEYSIRIYRMFHLNLEILKITSQGRFWPLGRRT